DVIQIDFEFVRACGDLAVKGEHVHVVAPPLDLFPVRAKDQACQVDNRSDGRMLSGDPFWIDESQRACGRGKRQFRMENVFRGLAQIHAKEYRLSRILSIHWN